MVQVIVARRKEKMESSFPEGRVYRGKVILLGLRTAQRSRLG